LKRRYPDQNLVHKRDINNSTPLHWACYSGAENAILYLIAWGADVNA
jgi:ankyrin repeat protein